jgi:ribosomal protein S18 acetylase RimI-like enzyme
MPDLPPSIITTATGTRLVVSGADQPRDRDLLHTAFNRILSEGGGYPQDGPVDGAEFARYWLEDKTAVVVAWTEPDRQLAGSYFLRPNGVGRAAHVGNAGYFVVDGQRGLGVGEALVRHSMATAGQLGFDALQFNFVFETNPARRLYERLGFEVVGRVPEVIDGEAVLIYWRRLDGPDPPSDDRETR